MLVLQGGAGCLYILQGNGGSGLYNYTLQGGAGCLFSTG